MKKMITFILCTAMTLAMAAFGTDTNPQEENPIIGGDPATWGPTEYETLAEAINACGFDFSVPDTVPGYQNKLFTVFNSGLIQVIYFNEDELNKLNEEELNNVNRETVNFNPNSLIIRKAAGNDDISGDYNKYSETNTISINNLEVTTNGSDGKVNVAIWTDNGYTFAITTNNSVDIELLSELIESVK